MPRLDPVALFVAGLIANGLLAAPPTRAQTSPSPEASTLPAVRATASGTPPPGAAAKEASVGVLGEQRLVDTPYSINVIRRDVLDRQQAAFLGDFLKNDPSAVVANLPVGFLTLRGFPVSNDGFLYDGLPGHVGLSDGRGQLEGFERIEVLKGPSAFLYGLGASSSLGGTLNYVPKQPPARDPIRSVALSYATKSLLGLQTDLGDRFGADRQFGWRLNLGYKNGEQAVDHYDWEHQAATLALDWRATRDLVFSAHYDAADNDLPRLPPFLALGAGLPVPDAPDASRQLALDWDSFQTVTRNAYLRADWTLNDDWSASGQLMRSSHHRPDLKQARFGSVTGADGSALLFGGYGGFYGTESNNAQALLHGKARTGTLQHGLTFGVAATHQLTRGSDGASFGAFPTNLYDPVDVPEPASQPLGPKRLTQKVRVSSLMAADIIEFTPQWSWLIGARHARMSVDNRDGSGAKEVRKTSPTTALMFKFRPDAMLYLNYAEGLEQGSVIPDDLPRAGTLLPPLKTRQVELGAKLDLGELALTAAVFQLDKPLEYRDTSTTPNAFVQDGRQRHRGLELTANGRATPDLSLLAGLMVLNPRASKTGTEAIDGKRPVGTPTLMANVWADQRVAPGWFVNGGLFHSGPQYLDAANTQKIPSSTRFDLGARYETRHAGVKATYLLGVENMADRNYWTSAQSGLLVMSEPRTVKFTARFDL